MTSDERHETAIYRDPVAAEFMYWVAIGVMAAITLYTCAQLITFGRAGTVAALAFAAFGSGLILIIDRGRPLRREESDG